MREKLKRGDKTTDARQHQASLRLTSIEVVFAAELFHSPCAGAARAARQQANGGLATKQQMVASKAARGRRAVVWGLTRVPCSVHAVACCTTCGTARRVQPRRVQPRREQPRHVRLTPRAARSDTLPLERLASEPPPPATLPRQATLCAPACGGYPWRHAISSAPRTACPDARPSCFAPHTPCPLAACRLFAMA